MAGVGALEGDAWMLVMKALLVLRGAGREVDRAVELNILGTHIHIFIHMYIYSYTHIYVYMCIYKCVHTQYRLRMYVYVCISATVPLARS